MLAAVLSVVLLAIAMVPQARAQISPSAIGVYYIGPEDEIAISINESRPYLVRVDQPELAQVLVINDVPLTEQTTTYFGQRVQEGAIGLVLFCGPLFPQRPAELRPMLGMSSFGLGTMTESVDLSLSDEVDSLQGALAWGSAPELQARTVISNPNLLKPILVSDNSTNVLSRLRGKNTRQVLIVGPWLESPTNRAWTQWPYFRYMIYRLIADAANIARPLSFADYPLSPVPRPQIRWTIAGLGGALMIGVGWLLYRARRRLFLKPPVPEPLKAESETPSLWRRVGFHRPLAGLLTLFPLGLILFLPIAVFNLRTVPESLLSNEQTLTNWQQVGEWMSIIALCFDAGVGLAVVYHFSIHRIHYPERSLRFFQFYVWWQLLSGVVLASLIVLGMVTVLHRTSIAHLTYHILVWTTLQVPGFLGVFEFFFRAVQRFDREETLRLVEMIATVVCQVVCVSLFSAWGSGQPAIGAALGGAMGLGLGLYAARTLTFALGAGLFIQAGHSLQAIFRPAYRSEVVRRALSYGFRRTVGTLAIALGSLFTVRWLASQLSEHDVSYTHWMALFAAMSIYDLLLRGLGHSLVPAMAEASALGYRTLLRYYVNQAMRYGIGLGLFLMSVLSAIGPTIWLELLNLPEVAGGWLLPILGLGAARWLAWMPHRAMEAGGRPGLSSWVMLVTHGLRVGGTLIFTPQWGLETVFIVNAGGLVLESLLAWILMHRLVVRVKINVWQTWIAPLGSAFLLYQGLTLLIGEVEGASLWVTAAGYTVMMVLAFPIFTGLTAILGGWDRGSLTELDRAVQLCRLSYPLSWLVLQLTRLGARISPLHGRFPVSIYTLAQEEAEALTHARTSKNL
jgi:O-antigen/teichoic acid export membrane protein